MTSIRRDSMALLVLLGAVLGLGQAARAGDAPAPPRVFRPFSELPDVVWFEGFEFESPFYESGKYHGEAPCLPGTHAYKLGETEIDKAKVQTLTMHIDKSPLKLPGGIDPKLLNMEFFIYAEDAGSVFVRLNHTKGEYWVAPKHIPKGGMWVPISLRFVDFASKNSRMEASHICTELRIYFKALKGNPAVYVDNILITTNNVSPADAMPRAMGAEKKMLAQRRRPDKDGFSYSTQAQEMLQAALKAANKRKNDRNILVVGETLPEGKQMDKILSEAAQKEKVIGFNFIAGTEPNGAPIAGLEDMRALLPFNLQKNDSELVLLMLSSADLTGDPRPAEGVQAVLHRVLAAGSVPVLCLPSAQGNDKVKGTLSSIAGICDTAGVPWVDTDFAIKGLTNPIVGGVLSAEAMDSLAGLAVSALRHTADSLKK